MRTEIVLIACALALVACEPEEPVPFAPDRDGSIERIDSGPRFSHPDGGQDAGEIPDAGSIDAEVDVDARVPSTDPTVDGTIGETEWAGAIEATADVAGHAPFADDRLTRLLAVRTDERLFVAIEGAIATGHAIVMYVDVDVEEPNGVVLSSGEELQDEVGALDAAISSPVRSLVSAYRPDFAWGTTTMPVSVAGPSDIVGWRNIAGVSTSFTTIGTGTSTRCTAEACETSIPLSASGLAGATTIALAVRIVDAPGAISNQTLPREIDPTTEIIGEVLLVPAPDAP